MTNLGNTATATTVINRSTIQRRIIFLINWVSLLFVVIFRLALLHFCYNFTTPFVPDEYSQQDVSEIKLFLN